MRLLIDSDVLLDCIAERESTKLDWNKLNALEMTGCTELWTTSAAYGAVRDALCTVLPDSDIRGALRSTLNFISICSVDGPDVRFALDYTSIPYHAALTESCARKIQADFIITHQTSVAFSRGIPRVTLADFFDVLEQEQGLAFDFVDF